MPSGAASADEFKQKLPVRGRAKSWEPGKCQRLFLVYFFNY
jgi:hypothetical protein